MLICLKMQNLQATIFPFVPQRWDSPPTSVITWDIAESIYKQHRTKGDLEFKHSANVCWYLSIMKPGIFQKQLLESLIIPRTVRILYIPGR